MRNGLSLERRDELTEALHLRPDLIRNRDLAEHIAPLIARWLRDAGGDAWDEGWQAAREVLELDGMKVWAHTVTPDGYEGNPYRDKEGM